MGKWMCMCSGVDEDFRRNSRIEESCEREQSSANSTTSPVSKVHWHGSMALREVWPPHDSLVSIVPTLISHNNYPNSRYPG